MYVTRIKTEHRRQKTHNERAVSPVVGVMLMLVVTIIIAAVVSGFAGGLVGGNNKNTPTLSMDVSIANNGVWSGSHFSAKVTGADVPIPTKNVKIVTSWNKVLANGTSIGNVTTITSGTTNTNLYYQPCDFMTYANWQFNSPMGYGTGVNGTSWPWQPYAPTGSSKNNLAPGDSRGDGRQWYGNYSLVTGTTMYAEPFGHGEGPNGGQAGSGFAYGYGVQTPFNYYYGSDGSTVNFQSTDTDQMMAVLGTNWNQLRAGDTVSVMLVYTPTGKTIFQKSVTVEG